ncbi:variant leucine-rich repeat-containing protein, partial [Nostoc sp.]|uniref:variant leucine-rich repeat-containing protein n=1 Tax=Nostoc sp. TaxID=1180 RepID=UPI00307104AF
MSLDSLKQEATNHHTSPQRLRELAAINDELRRLVAANPVADSSLLGELAIQARTNKDVEMQRAIASNPNTPTQWLIGLAYLFPEEFFSNPAYDLSILENVNSQLLLKLVFVCGSNAQTSFLEFAAGICETNLKRIRNDKYFQNFSLEQQYGIKYLRMRRGIIKFSFETFWEWREILIFIASHQNTSRKKLLELSTSGEDIVAEFAQLRLDCPNDDINFWDQVALNNKPNLILFIPRRLMFKLVQLPDISTKFLKAASQLETFTGIINIIANYPKTPKQVLDKLAKNSLPFIAEAAKLHINYAGELETGWRDLAESKIDRAQLSISTDNEEAIELRLWYAGAIYESTLPYLNQKSVQEYPSTLLKIVCSADTHRPILDNLENHPRVSQLITECITSLKQRETIVFDLLPQMLPIAHTELLNHPTNQINPVVTDLDTLFTKLEDRDWWKKVRYISIKKTKFPVYLVNFLHRIMEDRKRRYYLPDMLINFEIDGYKDPNSIFIRLSNLEYYGVILASDTSTSPQILSKLVKHPIQRVRVLVASHHNITQNPLDNLIDDRNPEVRAAALANPKLDSMLREQLASLENPNLSSLDLRELANSQHTAVKTKVTRHPNVDASILAKLAHDKLIVRLAVAKHPKTPAEILTRFTEHQDRRLPLAVAQNPGAPKDLLIQLATQPAGRGGFDFNPLNLAAVKSLLTQEPEAAIPFLDRCLKFPDRPSFSRFLVLMNPHIPSSFLARYYKSWFWPERYAIAQNPNTDRDICQQLTQDPNRIVRAAARDNLRDFQKINYSIKKNDNHFKGVGNKGAAVGSP